jgi:hypothetical protein
MLKKERRSRRKVLQWAEAEEKCRETGNSRTWQFPDSPVTYQLQWHNHEHSNSTGCNSGVVSPRQYCHGPATDARPYQIIKSSHLQQGNTAFPEHTRFGWRWCCSIGSCHCGVCWMQQVRGKGLVRCCADPSNIPMACIRRHFVSNGLRFWRGILPFHPRLIC